VSALEFIASVAWPVTVLVVVLIFRKAILGMLSGELESVKAGPFSVTWRRTIARVKRDVKTASAGEERTALAGDSIRAPQVGAPTSVLIGELAPLAEESPEAAILEAYSRVESELRDLLANPPADPNLDLNRLGLHSLADLAHQQGLIRAETQRAIDGILVMRNLAVQGQTRDVGPEQAIQYLVLVDGTLFAIRMDRAKRVTATASSDGDAATD